MSKLLNGKTVLITGGTTGIGLATAARFDAEGARVVVTGRNPETLAAARDTLPDGVEVWASDASDPKAIEALFARIRDELGGLDVLFLNAGIARFAPLLELPLSQFDDQFSVNVRGPWLALRHASSVLRDGASVFVNASTLHSKGLPGSSAYSATKAALRSLVRTAAAELAPRGIRVNAISPGPIETPIYRKLGLPSEAVDAFASDVRSQVPLQRFGRPEEIASAALFLASDLSSYVTGVDLPVDGGMGQV
ncbi:MAG TPA: SDR family oxidoreductase [Deltaproteobacteria bacterium]|nr:SDR family oxidoreductase [Deltaproteobacteria bacterium]